MTGLFVLAGVAILGIVLVLDALASPHRDLRHWLRTRVRLLPGVLVGSAAALAASALPPLPPNAARTLEWASPAVVAGLVLLVFYAFPRSGGD